MKLKFLAGAALVSLLAAPAAFAQDDWSATEPGWYGAIDAGGHHTMTMNGVFPGTGVGADIRTTNPDFVGFARIGYRLNGHVRIEIEGGYRHESIDDVFGTGDASGYSLCNANTSPGTCEFLAER